MYDGNQVLRFENKFKASDLGGLSVELTNRKGTGNYDKSRTEFNYYYVPLTTTSLKEQVYSTLNKNKIYYNDSKNVNLVNGAIITSGKEFFQSLGMKFKESELIVQVGKNKGKKVLIPDIKSEEDIPEKVKTFFDDSYKFLENLVGKENIIYSAIHYDEDTPHMHFYFLPIVNEVKRKIFETDSNGNIIYCEKTGKDGNKKMLPIQKKDQNGKNMFKIEKGKFLNCDQFWKDLGGKTSFAKIQDEYNKYILEKGFNLFRGNIGDNKHHKTKAQKEIEDLNIQLNEMKKEFEKNQKLNEIELETNKEILKIDSKEVLNPSKKKLGGYKEKDVNELINYSKQIQKENSNNENIIKKKDVLIEDMTTEIQKLHLENEKLKDGSAIKERDIIIDNQKKIIKQKNSIIKNLENQLEKVQETFNNFKEKMFNLCNKICRALAHKLGYHYKNNYDINYTDMELLANKVIKQYEKSKYDKSNDLEI